MSDTPNNEGNNSKVFAELNEPFVKLEEDLRKHLKEDMTSIAKYGTYEFERKLNGIRDFSKYLNAFTVLNDLKDSILRSVQISEKEHFPSRPHSTPEESDLVKECHQILRNIEQLISYNGQMQNYPSEQKKIGKNLSTDINQELPTPQIDKYYFRVPTGNIFEDSTKDKLMDPESYYEFMISRQDPTSATFRPINDPDKHFRLIGDYDSYMKGVCKVGNQNFSGGNQLTGKNTIKVQNDGIAKKIGTKWEVSEKCIVNVY